MSNRLLSLVVAAALASSPAAAQDPSAVDDAEKERLRAFYQQVEAARAVYTPIQEANGALLDAGDLASATRKLLEAVPEDQRTAAHDFVLGNALFSIEPDVSRGLHERALKADPDNILVLNEWALHLQRDGRWAEAEAAWERLLAHPAFRDASTAALRAEALLHLGRPADAVAAWKSLDVKREHGAIEETLGWVHAPRSPLARRADLLRAASARDADAARDLVFLDLRFDKDWWNVEPRDDYLEADLAQLEVVFGAEDRGLLELRAVARLDRAVPSGLEEMARGDTPEPAHLEASRARLQELGLLGPGARLPQDDVVAERLLDLLLRSGLATADELLAAHEQELRARATAPEGSAQALRNLCALLERTGSDALADVDQFGWDRFREPRCAGSLLGAAQARGRPDDALLADALAHHPRDATLLRLAMKQDMLAGRPTPPERVVALILASLEAPPDARELNLLFVKLEQSLAAAK